MRALPPPLCCALTLCCATANDYLWQRRSTVQIRPRRRPRVERETRACRSERAHILGKE